MADDLKVNSNTDILEFKRKFNLFVSNYDKGEFDGDFEITGDLKVDGDVEIVGELKGAETQIASAVSTYISEHPFAPEMLEGEDIEPANIDASGKIEGAEIVEKMSGYQYYGEEQNGWTKEVVYASAVKNGNKLTFVIAMNVTKTDASATGYCLLGNFVIPETIGAKLYPTSIGGYNVLDLKQISIAYDLYDLIGAKVYTEKPSSSIIAMFLIGSDITTLNKKYYVRYEVTFLLSENLATQE